MNDESVQSDEITPELVSEPIEDFVPPVRKTYVVTAENGLFKRGQQYDQGSEIDLDIKTAENFIALGEVEESQS